MGIAKVQDIRTDVYVLAKRVVDRCTAKISTLTRARGDIYRTPRLQSFGVFIVDDYSNFYF